MHQNLPAASIHQSHQHFNTVLGRGRGLGPVGASRREFADLDLAQLQEQADVGATLAVFTRFRDPKSHEGYRDKFKLLRDGLAFQSAEIVWDDWYNKTLVAALNMLGLGTIERSPWLVRSANAGTGASVNNKSIIHITDLRADRPWIGADEDPVQQALALTDKEIGADTPVGLRTICGLAASDLKPVAAEGARSDFERYCVQNNVWRLPTAVAAFRCPQCEGIAFHGKNPFKLPSLVDDITGIFSKRLFCSFNLTELSRLAACALDSTCPYTDILPALNATARAAVLTHLKTIIDTDPIAIFMYVLAVPERKHLAAFSQPQLFTALEEFPWAQALQLALPLAGGENCEPSALHKPLSAYALNLRI